jgi:hypothetical protein
VKLGWRGVVCAGIVSISSGIHLERTACAQTAASGYEQTAAKARLRLTVEPIFGVDVAPSPGWNEVVVTVENQENSAFVGSIENISDRVGSQALGIVTAAITVPPLGQTRIKLPVHLPSYNSNQFGIRLLFANGEEVARRGTSVQQHPSPTLIEWSRSRRLATELRGDPLPIATGTTGTTVTNRLRVGTPEVDATSGDPIVPSSPAAYVGVDAIVLTSADLARLKGAELSALAGFVLAGGTLAVVPTRPEDLRTAPLATLLGGNARPAPASRELYTLPGRASGTGSSPGTDPTRDRDESGGADPTLRESFSGYAGGNLHDSRFGAVASYGLGEVHLLAFDPLAPTNASDPWIHARVKELVARAYNRHVLRAFPGRDGDGASEANDAIRRSLDPNENFRGALGVSALLLVLYAILAGPVLHLRAQKRQKPLEPLVRAPFLAAGTFALLVLVGLAAKGFRGRARHVMFVETGAGMSRAAGIAYRGFFSSRAEQLSIRSIGPGAMMARTERSGQNPDRYLVDRDGIVLQNLAALPWQTIVVRENGFLYDMKGSVDVRRLPDGHLKVKNGLALPLRDVVIGDGSHATYFPAIAAGASVTDTAGRALPGRYRDTTSYGSPTHRLTSYLLRDVVGGPDGLRIAATWEMAEGLAQGSDFWPDDLPVLIAEVVSKGNGASESGLSLESERVLLRVVGEGGTP